MIDYYFSISLPEIWISILWISSNNLSLSLLYTSTFSPNSFFFTFYTIILDWNDDSLYIHSLKERLRNKQSNLLRIYLCLFTNKLGNKIGETINHVSISVKFFFPIYFARIKMKIDLFIFVDVKRFKSFHFIRVSHIHCTEMFSFKSCKIWKNFTLNWRSYP